MPPRQSLLVLATLSRPTQPTTTCLFCQFLPQIRSSRRYQSTTNTSTPTTSTKSSTVPPPSKKAQAAPNSELAEKQIATPQRRNRPHVRAYDGELVPQPLNRPLGLPYPPQAGQNSGIDDRTWKQKRDDFASYDKHIERRQGL